MQRTAEAVRDELLVLRSRDGDAIAFGELVERWQGRLFGHALQLTGRPDAALDAVQETWIAVVRGLSRLEDPARFPGFAHRILARRCADWTRRQERRRRTERALADAQPAPAPERSAEHASDAARVRELLAALPMERRTLLALHYLHDLPIARIAAILRIPPGTVKSRLHEARAQLRRALQGRPTPCPSSTT
jgi:RNA polymerase sigma factor (sigma-70 family)